MSFVIITDSCADLPVEIINSSNLTVIPQSFAINGKNYKDYADGREISNAAFYGLMREKKIAKTAQINTVDFIKYAEPLLEAGNDLLLIIFSSALSGSYNSIRLGCIELMERFPKQKIINIDSLCASLGFGLLVYKAIGMQKQGLTIEETAQKIEDMKLKLTHLFTVEDLGVLKRGGRLSATASFIGTLFQLKPVLHVSNEGKLVPLEKVRGRKASLRRMVELFKEMVAETETVFISHGDDIEAAENVKNMVLEIHPEIKEIVINPIGPTIGAHSGPGTIALFFIGKKR